MRCYTTLVTFLTIGAIPIAVLAQSIEKPRDLSGIGSARGWVLDGSSGLYLEGVKVELVLPPYYKQPKGSDATTGAEGFYSLKAPIGSHSSKIAIPADGISIASILGGGARKVTNHVNASQFLMRASKQGYKTYVGPVRVAHGDANDYVATMEPIQLARDQAPFGSFTSKIAETMTLKSISFANVVALHGKTLDAEIVLQNAPLTPRQKLPMTALWAAKPFDQVAFNPDSSNIQATYKKKIAVKGHELKPGPHLLVFGFLDKYGSFDYKTPYLVPINYPQMAIVGDPTVVKPPLADAVQAINRILIDQPMMGSPELIPHLRVLAAEWPSAVFDGAWMRSPALATAIRSAKIPLPKIEEVDPKDSKDALNAKLDAGDLSDAHKSFPRFFREIYSDTADVIDLGAKVQKNPADFEARFQFEQGRASNLSGDRGGRIAKIVLPVMPEPKTPRQNLLAGNIAVITGQPKKAVGYFTAAAEDAKSGPQAIMALGDLALSENDRAKAKAFYESAYAMKESKSILSFYSHLSFAQILLSNREYEAAGIALQRALLTANDRSTILKQNVSQVYVGGSSYQISTSAVVMGSTGFAYPEAFAVQRLLFYLPSINATDNDPLGVLMCARAMAELSLTKEAEVLVSTLQAGQHDEWLLSTRALIAFLSQNATKSLELQRQLALINSKNADGRWLASRALDSETQRTTKSPR